MRSCRSVKFLEGFKVFFPGESKEKVEKKVRVEGGEILTADRGGWSQILNGDSIYTEES